MLFLLSSPVAGKLLWDKATEEALDMYHQQCFQIGGYVINNQGEVVMCQALTTIPKQELEKYEGTTL